MTENLISDWLIIGVAAYAAIVATAALILEVRRWIESGPRLNLHIMPEAEINGLPGTKGGTFLVATVTNRGNAPTTITHFALCDYGTRLRRIISKPIWNGIVINPQPKGSPPIIPTTLQPGERWMGMAPYDDKGELKSKIEAGQLHVMIYAGHADKPTSKRVKLRPRPPKDAEEI